MIMVSKNKRIIRKRIKVRHSIICFKTETKKVKDMASAAHATVFFDITIGGQAAGRITMTLASNTPRTSENFKQLCTMEQGYGF